MSDTPPSSDAIEMLAGVEGSTSRINAAVSQSAAGRTIGEGQISSTMRLASGGMSAPNTSSARSPHAASTGVIVSAKTARMAGSTASRTASGPKAFVRSRVRNNGAARSLASQTSVASLGIGRRTVPLEVDMSQVWPALDPKSA
jgi:hypothetical protein